MAVATAVTFHGTQVETDALLSALAAHCECKFGMFNVRLTTCGPHSLLTGENSQRVMDTLLFYRRMRDVLEFEEWNERDSARPPLPLD